MLLWENCCIWPAPWQLPKSSKEVNVQSADHKIYTISVVLSQESACESKASGPLLWWVLLLPKGPAGIAQAHRLSARVQNLPTLSHKQIAHHPQNQQPKAKLGKWLLSWDTSLQRNHDKHGPQLCGRLRHSPCTFDVAQVSKQHKLSRCPSTWENVPVSAPSACTAAVRTPPLLSSSLG